MGGPAGVSLLEDEDEFEDPDEDFDDEDDDGPPAPRRLWPFRLP
jgi:hypothetical protein